jgi:hypothetical protein
MKTLFALCFLAAGLATSSLPGQVYLYGADPSPQPEAAPAIVYEAPVVYQAPVIYQGPVVYQAPVIYQAPVPVASGACDPVCSPPPSTVIYVGGPGSECRNPCEVNSSPTVIYFGRGESYQRGYQFTRPR